MHNIKEIRKDFDAFSKALKKRSIDIDLNKLKKLDIDNRDLIHKKETLEKEKKDISKTKDKALFSRSKEITQSIDKVTDQQSKIKSDLDEILSSIPNIPHDDVPVGSNENENVELTKSGQIPNFEFTPTGSDSLTSDIGALISSGSIWQTGITWNNNTGSTVHVYATIQRIAESSDYP